MLLKLFAVATLALVTPAARAQTAQPGQPVPAAEPPVKSVPLSGHQTKPLRVDDNGPVDGPAGPNHAGRGPGRRHATRAARHARGAGHSLGGHGRRH